ncbi:MULTISPECIES: hypothetical protein [unclassified Mucilaginibacter]|uniref:hypothetical protein n=1 Tax=unclassified Mucilaginibacter TaxID=2617802 RepID=UPI0033907D7F
METNDLNIKILLRLAGLAQIVLVLGSLAIPKVLMFKAGLVTVRPLFKQMFWTYAAYILVTNLCFGLLSLFAYQDLLNHSVLAVCVTGFIAVYWISRVLVQFFYFDKVDLPNGPWHKVAEAVLVTLFITLSVVYSFAFYLNFQQI